MSEAQLQGLKAATLVQLESFAKEMGWTANKEDEQGEDCCEKELARGQGQDRPSSLGGGRKWTVMSKTTLGNPKK